MASTKDPEPDSMRVVLPNFIVIGAPKCGTTTLCDRLGNHPNVFMSTPKEPHFFGRNEPEKTWKWYTSLFSGVESETAIGEGSTSYTRPDIGREAAEAIAEAIPDCRLIYIVRQPLKRLESDWRMRLHEGWHSDSINSAVKHALAHGERKLVSREENADLRWQRLLLTQGSYWRNLNEYRRLFSDEQILVVFLEDFVRSPHTELARCFEHIHIDPLNGPTKVEALNRGTDTRRDGHIAKFVRQRIPLSTVKAVTPDWLLALAKAVLTSSESIKVEWDPEVLRDATRWFEDDSRRFLKFCGKPPDFWD